MSMFMAGPIELLLILVLGGGGTGLPVGLPPAPPDPVVNNMAPDQCLAYLSWSGMATPDPESSNHTERLLADPEVQRLAGELERRIVEGIKRQVGKGEGPEAAALVDDVAEVVKTVLTRPTAIALSDVIIAGPVVDVKAGAIVNLGDKADDIRQRLERIERMAMGGAAKEAEGESATWHALPMPPDAPPVRWGVQGQYLIVGMGAGTADEILKMAKGNPQPPEWLKAIRQQLPVPRPANVLYVDTGQIIKRFAPMGGPEVKTVLEAVGVANVQSIASVTGLDEAGCVTRTQVALDGEPAGLLAALIGEPLAKTDLAVIPQDSTVAMAVRFDAARFFDAVMEMIGKVEPRAREEAFREMGQFESQLGVPIRETLASVGDVWRVYNSPGEGGLLVTGLTAVVSVRDRDRLADANERLVRFGRRMAEEEMSRRSRRRGATIGEFTFAGQKVYFLNVIGEAFPIAPAWCITEDELVVALFPQNVKAYLSRAAKGRSGFASGGVPAVSDSLADVPQVAALFDGSRRPMCVGYLDTSEFFEKLYPIVQILGQIVCSQIQSEGVDIDVSLLPSAPAIARHLRPSTSAAYRTEAGVLFESRQTLPIGGGGMAVTTMLPWLFMARAARVDVRMEEMRAIEEMESATKEADGAITLPEPSEGPMVFQSPRDRARQAMSMNNLKQIALAMHMYHETHNRFPAAATYSQDGKPLLSWRVQLLPFMEEKSLYDQFRLDEPWDSEHNRVLIAKMPAVYKTPGSAVAEEGKTNYLGVGGPNAVFSGKEGVRIRDIVDGTSNTIMIVEADDKHAVEWTKPVGEPYAAENPAAGLVGLRVGGFLAAFCDGSVRLIPQTTAAETLRRLFQYNDGRPVDLSSSRARPPRPALKFRLEEAPVRQPVKERIVVPRVEQTLPVPPPTPPRRTPPPLEKARP